MRPANVAPIVLSTVALAQTPAPSPSPFDSNATAVPANVHRPRSAPPFTSPAAIYSGFSGPGEEVSGDGLGGWRSGREGVRYKGPRPKPGWQLDWDAKGTSSELAIERGLLPPLKPIRELHLRDTVIRKGGDGFYYMTGSNGPYVDALARDAPLTGGIDATLFQDDDGVVYFTWGRGTTLHRLKGDLSGFADAGRAVAVDDASLDRARASGNEKGALFEGVSLFKRAGTYYLTGAVFIGGIDRTTGRNGRYSSVVMTSRSLHGPYGQWHEAVPGGGGGNYFDHRGRWYCTLFGNDEAMPFREKPGVVGIEFEPDGRVVVARDQPDWVLRPGDARSR